MNQQPVSYVSKDIQYSKRESQQQYRKVGHNSIQNNGNNNEERNGQYQKKDKQFTRRNNSNEQQQKQNNAQQNIVICNCCIDIKARAQIKQPQNKIYDFQTLISAFSEQIQPPPELTDLIAKIPHLFSKTPSKPLSIQILNSISDEDEPEWMKSNTCQDTFQIQDVEIDLEKKRVEYQIKHGTYEKKQIQKQKNKDEQQDEKQPTIESEKARYIQMREQESKESQIAYETKAKLQELFNFSSSLQQAPQSILANQKIISVEEIEKKALKTEKVEKAERNKPQKQQQVLETIQFSQSNKSDDLFEYLQKIGIQINEPLKVTQPEILKISTEKIKKTPFSVQAQLHQKQQQEKLWYYIDNVGKVQGGFPTENMDLWYEHKYLKPKLKMSWESPGKWVTLDQFILNLELIQQGRLNQSKAMEPQAQISNNNQQYNNTSQQVNQSNAFNINPQIQQQQYQYTYNNQLSQMQNQQRQNSYQNNKNKNRGTNSNQYYNQNGFVFDTNDFPTIQGNK